MKFTKKECFDTKGKCFSGLYEIQPCFFSDERGYFLETYTIRDFKDCGLALPFVQDNQAKSIKGVVRGLHFQKKYPQGKLVHCITGSIYDVSVDLRKGSETFGNYFGIILDAEKMNMIYIPEGFAHGYTVLTDTAIISYKSTEYYHPEDEGGIIWNDASLNINWYDYLDREKTVLSQKDRTYPAFSSEDVYYNAQGKWMNEKDNE